MSFPSLDALQAALTTGAFANRTSSRKAAGRALGTFVELLTYYMLRAWGHTEVTCIERRIPEFGSPEDLHNVEFSLHPLVQSRRLTLGAERKALPISASKLLKACPTAKNWVPGAEKWSGQVLTSKGMVQHARVLASDEASLCVATLLQDGGSSAEIAVTQVMREPFAMVECKRVGIEEGQKRGPQTIEKAKQGAYVALAVSSLQKVRSPDGTMMGVRFVGDQPQVGHYYQMLQDTIQSGSASDFEHFTMTVGVVSNHGNWHEGPLLRKELRVLKNAYDWLLFLSDEGLTEFAGMALISPSKALLPVKSAFERAYTEAGSGPRMTKVEIERAAHIALEDFVAGSLAEVEAWFRVVQPQGAAVGLLKQELQTLSGKPWTAWRPQL